MQKKASVQMSVWLNYPRLKNTQTKHFFANQFSKEEEFKLWIFFSATSLTSVREQTGWTKASNAAPSEGTTVLVISASENCTESNPRVHQAVHAEWATVRRVSWSIAVPL